MDMQANDGAEPSQKAHEQELTYHWLYARVQGLVDHSIYPKAGRLESWSFRVGMLAALIGVLSSFIPETWLPAVATLVVVSACLAVEITGFVIGGILAARRGIHQFTQPRLSHVREMDAEFAQWQAVIADLRAFPREHREQRLRYVCNLRGGMIDRMGLMYGGMQHFGPFPLLIAFYLQFRNWKWGDWGTAFDVGPTGAFLIFGIVFFYLMGWILIGLRVRLDTYAALLEASIQEPEPTRPPGTPASPVGGHSG